MFFLKIKMKQCSDRFASTRLPLKTPAPVFFCSWMRAGLATTSTAQLVSPRASVHPSTSLAGVYWCWKIWDSTKKILSAAQSGSQHLRVLRQRFITTESDLSMQSRSCRHSFVHLTHWNCLPTLLANCIRTRPHLDVMAVSISKLESAQGIKQ